MKPGDMVNGRYEIINEIGGGGMAIVYKAKCHVLNRIVAMKVLRPEYTIDEEFVRKFNMEAQAAASLSHPNIVAIYDVGHEDKTYYIIVEYVDGKTLKDMIRDRGSLSHHETVKIATQICDALAHAHANHIVHRDIKSHNILISNSGQVKVTDFGIAKAVTAQTVTLSGSIIGSIHYFSPEQARGGVVGIRSDIYSLGVVLYEMMTGKLPFEGDSPISVALKHIQNDPVPPIELNPAIPQAMNDIIMKAMNKDESKRFNNVLELKSDLVKSLYLPEGWYTPEDKGETEEDISEAVAVKEPAKIAVTQPAAEIVEEHKAEGETLVAAKTSKPKRSERSEGNSSRSQNTTQKSHVNGIKKALIIFVCIIALTGAMVAAGYYGFQFVMNLMRVPEVEVPTLVGMKLEDAEELLAEQDLKYTIEEEIFDEEAESGIILEQNPKEGTTIKAENPISLVVSKGQEELFIPNVTNIDVRDAETQINDAGFAMGEITYEFHDEVQENYVISQTPSAETAAVRDAAVDLLVSKGPEPEKIFLEDYTGKTEDAAVKDIISLGLTTGSMTYEESYTVEEGVVISQKPAKGTEMEDGAAVSLVISKGPGPSAAKKSSIMVMLPSEPEQLAVKVYATDNQGRKKVYDKTHEGGSGAIVVEFSVFGNALVEVYINDELYDKSSIINTGAAE